LQKSVTADDPAQGSSHPDRRLESGAVLATPERSCLVGGVASETHTPSPGAIAKQDFEKKGGSERKIRNSADRTDGFRMRASSPR